MRFRTRITAITAMTVAAAACAVAPATAALAAPQKAPAAHTVAVENSVFAASLKSTSKACWDNLDTGKWRCFSSFAGMKSAIASTGRPLFVAAKGASGKISASAVHPMSSTYLLNTDFTDSNYSGTSYSYTTSDPDMCAGNVYSHPSEPSGWNDRISSINAYGNCSEKLWENINFSGSTYGYSTGTGSLGSFNDQASSERVQ